MSLDETAKEVGIDREEERWSKDVVPGIPKIGEMNKSDREGMASEVGRPGDYSFWKLKDKGVSKGRDGTTASNAANRSSKMSAKG